MPPYLIWAGYFGAALSIWSLATLATVFVLRRPAPDAAAIAMTATFGNVVMLGLPLASKVLGPEAEGTIALILSVHSPGLWALAAIHLALADRSAKRRLGDQLLKVARDLATNPIIVAIALGSLWRLTALGLDPIIDRTLAFLGQAAIPAALVALGLSLVGFRVKGQAATLGLVLVLKLLLMPLTAWVICTAILGLPPVAAGVITIFAAMPTGANAFLFATQSGRAANSAGGAVALGTALSITSASMVVWLVAR